MNLYWLAILYLQEFEINNSSVGFRNFTSPMSNRNCFAPRSVCHSGVGRLRDIMPCLSGRNGFASRGIAVNIKV